MGKRFVQTISLAFLLTVVLATSVNAESQEKVTEESSVQFSDRSGIVLLTNNRSDSEDYPFILEAKLISETSDELIVDVKYFMSDTITGSYSISVHPDMNAWSYTSNTLHPGINTQIITISFRPQNPEQTGATSRLLHLYVNHYENNQYVNKVFDRTIEFPKTWTR